MRANIKKTLQNRAAKVNVTVPPTPSEARSNSSIAIDSEIKRIIQSDHPKNQVDNLRRSQDAAMKASGRTETLDGLMSARSNSNTLELLLKREQNSVDVISRHDQEAYRNRNNLSVPIN